MANIFETVARYYEADGEAEAILPQATIERYLRRQLWRGMPQEDLEMVFALAAHAMELSAMMGLEGLDEFEPDDLQEDVDMFFLEHEDVPPTEENVMHAIGLLASFLTYLHPEAEADIGRKIEKTRAAYYADGEFVDPTLAYDEDDDDFILPGNLLEELEPAEIDAVVNELLQAIQVFFRASAYHDDLQRAMMLYFGPVRMNENPEDVDEETMQRDLQGFWDFFLFDYHMIAQDRLPLRVFFDARKKELPEVQLGVLRDLLDSTFTIFYIEHLEGDTALCRALFTDEEMELPRPETGGQDPRKTLLYGHVHADGVMLLNYIMIVPATAALRHRIQEEIERLHAIYCMQKPGATMEEFFHRHAAAVRHVIQNMTSYAQLTIVPEIEKVKPIDAPEVPQSLQAAAARLREHAKALHFSAYEQVTLLRLYRDAVYAEGESARATENEFLAATILYFAIQNVKDIGDVESFFASLDAEKEFVVTELSHIFVVLGMLHPDPRYFTELGFVHLLFQKPAAPEPPAGVRGGWPR